MRGFWWCHNRDIFIYLIYGKGLQADSVQCTVCIKWTHKRCSGWGGASGGWRDYGCVKSFSYLGVTLDGDGGCPLVVSEVV